MKIFPSIHFELHYRFLHTFGVALSEIEELLQIAERIPSLIRNAALHTRQLLLANPFQLQMKKEDCNSFPFISGIKSFLYIIPGRQGRWIRLHKSKSFIYELFSFVGKFPLISRIRGLTLIFLKENTDKVKNFLPGDRRETAYIFQGKFRGHTVRFSVISQNTSIEKTPLISAKTISGKAHAHTGITCQSFFRINSMIARTKPAMPETVTSVSAIGLKCSYVCKSTMQRPTKREHKMISSLSTAGISFDLKSVPMSLSDVQSYQVLYADLCLDFCVKQKRLQRGSTRWSRLQRIESIGSYKQNV